MGTRRAFKEHPRSPRGLQVTPPSLMSSSYNISTAYDALDDTIYDLFDLDAYCSSLSPPVSTPEPVHHAATSALRPKRYPKMRGHPRPSPTDVSAPSIPSMSSVPLAIPAKPSKGKGCQHPTPAVPPTSPVDPPSSLATTSAELTPEQHLCFVRMLKRLDEWLAQGWQPGVDESHLQTLAEIFNAAESIAEGSISTIRRTDLAWRLADSEGWERSAGSSIMGTIDIQVTVTKILFKDYREPLMTSFRSFLGQKEAELGNEGRPSGVSGPSLQETVSQGDSKPDLPKRVQFSGLDSTPGGTSDVRPERNESRRLSADEVATRIPTYDEVCRSLTQHLAFVSGTTYMEWVNFLFTFRESTPGANTLRSRHASCPLPDGLFAPVAADNQLRYLLAGCGRVTNAHPLGGFRCFQCNSFGHWSANHDRSR